MSEEYDVIIIGGGPGGLTAAIYTARAGLSSLLIEGGMVGGKMIEAGQLDNYPGFPDGISGFDLGQLMYQQATKYGHKMTTGTVTIIEVKDKHKVVRTTDGDFSARAVIITGGSERQKLGVPGEKKFTGKGVSFCSTCDGPLFKDKPVAVVGGGNVAVTEALHLTRFASHVTVIHRRDKLRATHILQEKATAQAKIDFRWNTIVEAIEGDNFVEKLKLRNVLTGEVSTLSVAGVFISVGLKPNTGYLKDIVALDKLGQVIVNNNMETQTPGIFAAGDIRSGSIRQVIAAAGDGAIAAISAQKYLSK